MDYIYGKTADAWLDEKYGRLSEGDDGTAEIVRLIVATAWPEGDGLAEESCALDGRLSLGGRPVAAGGRLNLLMAAATERLAPALTNGRRSGMRPL